MGSLFASGRIIDFILVLIVLEIVALVAYRRVTGRGPALNDFLLNTLSGMALMVTLRFALTGAPWPQIALGLIVALSFHLADLRARW